MIKITRKDKDGNVTKEQVIEKEKKKRVQRKRKTNTKQKAPSETSKQD